MSFGRAFVLGTLVIAVLLVAPAAQAGPPPPCGPASGVNVQAGHLWLHQHTGLWRWQVYEESNGVPGLQTGSCRDGGVVKPPDTLRAMLPPDLGLGCFTTICL